MAQGVGFLPTQISGCDLWLDAADPNGTGILPANSTGISTWKDKSPNGFTGTAVSSPVFLTNLLNGLPGISFNGTSQYINFGNQSALNYGTDQLYIFAVSKYNNTGNGNIVGKTSQRDFAGRYSLLRVDGSLVPLVSGSSSVNNAGVLDTSMASRLLTMTWDRANINLFQNGTSVFTVALADTSNITSNTDILLVAAYPNGTGTTPPANGLYMNGYIHEIVIYLASLTTFQRQQVEGYLAWKWGLQGSLPSTHPFARAPPFTAAIRLNIQPLVPVRTLNTASFSPLQINNCVTWMDAADTTTMTFNGDSNILQWADKSSNSYKFVQTNRARQPAYIRNVRQGNGVIRFTSANQTFLADGNSLPVGTNSVSMFGVIMTTASNTQMTIWAKTALSVGSGKWAWFRDGTSMIMTFEGPSAGAWNPTYTDTYTPGNYRVMSMVCDRAAGNTSVFTNGTNNSIKTFTADTTTNLTSSRFMLLGAYNDAAGSSNPGGYYLNGDICELIIYTSNLSVAQRQQVEGYLAFKWGLQTLLPPANPMYMPLTFSNVGRQGFYTPLNIAGCTLWLDAADNRSLLFSGGSNIGTWTNKVNSTLFTRGGNASRLSLTTYNKNPTVFFDSDGTNNAWFTGSLTLTANTSVVQVLTPLAYSGGTPWSFLWSWATGGTNNRVPGFRSSNASPDFQPYITWVGNGTNRIPITNGTTYLNFVEFTGGGANTRYSINGNLTPTSGTIAASNVNSSVFILGGDGVSAAEVYGRFFLSEIIVFSNVLTDSQRQQMEGYLAWKWGLQSNLPSNHPWVLFPPPPVL